MAITISVISTKGGTGKTTTAVNLAGLLADLGQRVLIVDADPQDSASSYYPITQRAPLGLTALITEGASGDVISTTGIDNLDLVVSDAAKSEMSDRPTHRLQSLRDWIRDDPLGRLRLRQALADLRDEYDIVIVDTQGAIGPLQDCAVLAADMLVSPIPPEMLSAREFFRGTVQMIERLRPFSHFGAAPGPLHGLIYKQDRTIDAKRIAHELRNEFFAPSGGRISILNTVVPLSVAYKEAASAQVPVHRWDAMRRGASPCAAETLLALVHELLPHLSEARWPDVAADFGSRRGAR